MNKKEKEVQQAFLNSEKAVLKQLETNYEDALADINEKIELLLARQDADMQHVIYQVEYQKALRTQVQSILEQLQTNEFETLSEYLTNAYTDGFVGTMYNMAGQGVPFIFPIDQKQVLAAVQLDSKITTRKDTATGKLYTALYEDITDLKKKIASEVSRGISSGMMYKDIARNVSNQARIPMNNAMRIARTEAHRIQCKATMDACDTAKGKGADVVKQWDSSLDGRTRASHRRVDGEIRELDEPFSNGLMYPGDPSGGASEVVNCRCALLQRARWALDEEELETLKERAEYYGLDKTKDFEDYKKKYLQASERVREDAQMMKNDKTQQDSIEAINQQATDSLLVAYDDRRKHFDLNETPASELKQNELNTFVADYTGLSVESANAFNDTITRLSNEYYTGFTRIEVGKAKDFFGSNKFASTVHMNSVGQKTLIINPTKTKNYENMVERVEELSKKGYAVNILDGKADEYIATHEFAHSLIDLSGNYKNFIGMDVKQMQRCRNEIESIFADYTNEVARLEEALTQAKKNPALMDFNISAEEQMKAFQAIQDAQNELNKVKISRYSMNNADEFMAEAFTQAQIGKEQGQYSEKVMEVLDGYFKKEPLENIGESSTIKLRTNLFDKDDPIYLDALSVDEVPGFEDVCLHGTSSSVQTRIDGKLTNMSASEFASYLKESTNYNGGDIRLASCETGKGDNSFAQQLSKELGVRVMAPDSDVYYAPNEGVLFVGSPHANVGEWRVFNNGEEE